MLPTFAVTGDAALSLSALPVGFISQMRECTRQFCNSQRETILANIAAYISPDREVSYCSLIVTPMHFD